MKRLLREWLAAVGVVSARRHNAALKQLETLKAISAERKNSASAAASRAQELEARLRRQSDEAGKLQQKMDKWKEQRQQDFRQLQLQLAKTERELKVARDHLMAIEVKLDILEGAANVLDTRTRVALSSQRSGTGAPA